MDVVATAGHIDHGKSTLVHALTGMQPDRWEEERRRGLTIGLGFAWTTLPNGAEVAFVDVPGHERFVSTMLAGVGPVPATMVVVAADEGWRAQTSEHVAALDALGVSHGILVVTRCDLADPEPARTGAQRRLAGTSLAGLPSVAVSGRTGAGLDDLRRMLASLVAGLPTPDRTADVRLWVDRSFSVRGVGTVVTGTLPAGTLRVGDELLARGPGLPAEGRPVRVRGMQTLGRDAKVVPAVARVALNLRGVERLARGAALLTPGGWLASTVVDVALRPPGGGDGIDPRRLLGDLVVHTGAAAVPVRVRHLGREVARLTLAHPLPLRTGDRGVLRDPGRREVVAGVVVLDVRPPQLRRRGAARARADELVAALADRSPATAVARAHLRAVGFVRPGDLRAMGLPLVGTNVGPGWYADDARWAGIGPAVRAAHADWERRNPLAAGMPAEALRRTLDLPDPGVLAAAVDAAGLVLRQGLVQRAGTRASLPPAVEKAVQIVEEDLASAPFAAPDAGRLERLGLGVRELAAAARAGRLHRIADGVVLAPGAVELAEQVLAGLAQPFTLSTVKSALGTTRRVAVPLLEFLAARGVTERLPDGTHRLVRRSPRAVRGTGREQGEEPAHGGRHHRAQQDLPRSGE